MPRLRGSLTVLAAASLTEPFADVKTALGAKAPGLRLAYSFAGSAALARQIADGAPADVFASAGGNEMQDLARSRLVVTPRLFARNRLEIAVAPGNPKHVGGLADLARSDLAVVLADPSVPAGRYARQALSGARVEVRPRSLELDVKAALAKVVAGEADAAVVYQSDVKSAGARVTGVAIPDAQNVIVSYPVAVVKGSRNRSAAEAFVDYLLSPPGQAALQAHGFLPR